MAESSTRIDQILHGYEHGHDLLAASMALDDATASLLSHNSDSAPNASTSEGPFLTGYPLPDGRYVIARTWPDEVADRPNTVITLSVILPTDTQPFSMELLLAQLAEPPQMTLESKLFSFDVSDLSGPPLQLSGDEAAIASEFYARSGPLHASSRASRERIALAVWQQLWRSARCNLQFCTAPDTDRFSKAPRPLRFHSDPTSTAASRELPDVVPRDLQDPGSFREFVHFVGSGERAVGLMQPFAAVYSMLTEGRLDPEALARVLRDYKGTEPRRLRRLKRRVIGFHRGVPAWNIDQFQLLHALATEDLGNMVYASDASLDRWLRLCWDLDPSRTVDALAEAVAEPDPPKGPPTAREAMSSVFAANAPDLITPNTVAIAAVLHSSAVAHAIWTSNDPSLWRAWSELQPSIEVPVGAPFPEFDWAAPLQGTRHNAEAVARVLRRYPEALDHLIGLADAEPAATDLTVDLTEDAKRLIRYRLEHDDTRLRGLARLADARRLPRALNSTAWIKAIRGTTDEIVTAVGYAIARSAGVAAHEVAVETYASLFDTLSADGGTDAWDRLNSHLRGNGNPWDRCGLLTEDFAHLLKSYPANIRGEVATILRKRNSTAASAVEHRIRSEVESGKRKKFRLWDPTTW